MRSSDLRLTRRQAIEGLLTLGAFSACLFGEADAQTIAPNPVEPKPEPKRKPKARAAETAAWLRLPPTPAMPTAMRSGLATVNGTSIFFAQFGEGPPILMLHGGLASSNYWAHQVEALAQSFSITVMDTRGHGRSPMTSRALSYNLFAEDVAGLLEFLKIPAVAIVGWSDGAITGLQLAMTQPSNVSRLFAFGANSSRDGLKPNGVKSPVFASYADRCKSEYALMSPHPERWSQLVDALRVMWRTEPNFTREKLATVKLPTAICDGEYDEIIKRDHSEHIAAAIPGARLMILPDVSHFAMLQKPAQFTAKVKEFLTAPN